MASLLSRSLAPAPALIKAARRLVFPDQCPRCGTLVAEEGGLCGPCWRDTPFLAGLVCDLCGTGLIGPDDGSLPHCDACRSLPRPWAKGRAVFDYSGAARHMVLGFKHGDRLDLGPHLADWMAARAGPLIRPGMVLVPVPVHWRRLLARRYNQAAVLTRLLAPRLGLAHLPDALRRCRNTPPQSGDGFAGRAAALEGAIAVTRRQQPRLAGRPVLLVDDVMTSGATLTACCTALLAAQVPLVHVLLLARAHQRA
ncbi:ComF family protein [Mangrovicoccus algicola]|uniref:ComF family protein n=1 Tax=Mangrovicoccus algicola TaxID=2771008 RepID=A0A8J6YYE7_9RHOB|nr:ComF family protein [Mangrovicoccus algicola]MBE3638256.1 ComF family protein [Mangrovicoccus algicola]